LREIFWIQSDQEGGPALLSTLTKAIVARIGRDLDDSGDSYFICLLPEHIDQSARYVWANVQPLRHLFVLLQDFIRHEPNKSTPLNPFVKHIGTAVLSRHIRTLEGRYARNHH